MAIQNLSKVSTLSLSDLVAIFSQSLGADACATLSTLLTFLQSQLTSNGDYVTQYAAPSANAFTVAIAPPVQGESTLLLLTPTGTFAAGTITLPAVATCIDGQELLCSCTQIVTALTVAPNGATLNGAPTALAANGFFNLRFDGVSKAWFRVG